MTQTNPEPGGTGGGAAGTTMAGPLWAAGIMVGAGLVFGVGGVAYALVSDDGTQFGQSESVTVAQPSPWSDESEASGDANSDDGPDEGASEDSPSTTGKGDEGEPGRDEESSADEPRAETYEIEWGDTLSQISVDTGVSVDTLAEANDIANPDLIYAGSALLIPQAN